MGEDTQGNVYPSIQRFWNTTVSSKEKKQTWYDTTLAYWEKSEASVNGVLSGHSYLSDIDLQGSNMFLNCLKSKVTPQDQTDMFSYVIDCGAGIGRITNGCLLHHFQKVKETYYICMIRFKQKLNLKLCFI
jgi:protein N-terminal methyltransferase